MSNNKLKGILYALISSGTFGMIPLFVIPLKNQSHIQETSILFYRYLFSGLVIGTWCLLKKKSLKISTSTGLRICALSLFYTVTALALFYSYNLIPSGTATTLHFLYPLMVALFMTLFYKEKISFTLLVTALLSLAGVGLLSWTDGGFMNKSGLFLAFFSAVLYAVYISGLSQKGINTTDSKVITFYIMLLGALIFGVLSFFTGGIDPIPDTKAWINVLALALVPTLLSNLTLVLAVKNAGATTASVLGSAEPVTAILIGFFIFSEPFTLYSLMGLLLIMGAVTYIILSNNRKKNITAS